MIKLSDYVMQFFAARGADTVFTVSGGGIMHLLDSLGRNRALKYYCNYHEQASAICAEAYARFTGRPAVCLVTVGPAAANLIAGSVGAWYDGLPAILVTGQVRRDAVADYTKIRQFGPQEGNTVGLASSVTKYAKLVVEPESIRYELEKAWHIAVSGRPGPVLLDIPLDVQAAQIDETKLRGFEPESRGPSQLGAVIDQVVALLAHAKRPVLVGGAGVRMGDARDLFVELAERLDAPVVMPFSAKDLLPDNHPLNLGVLGPLGQRAANFTVQSADLMISCAAGFSVNKIGFSYKGFAPRAKKVVIDIDDGQLNHQAIKPDVAVLSGIKEFLSALLPAVRSRQFSWSPKWLPACRGWRKNYPVVLEEYRQRRDAVDAYVFMEVLSDALSSDDTVVAGNGLDVAAFFQALKVKPGQRAFTNNNWGSMGWALPMAIGASIANGHRRSICVTGDGSVTWNLQELLMLQQLRLPVKIFIFNNQGYSCIRATQDNFFEGRYVAADATSGVADPDFEKIAGAFGLAYFSAKTNDDLADAIKRTLAADGPALCDLAISRKQAIAPKVSAFRRPDGTLESRPLEDMAPFLPREEIAAIMHQFDDES